MSNGSAAGKKLIVIDPGHQEHGDSSLEPDGPGSGRKKAKVTGGATGVATGKPEYQLNLEISKKLQAKLESRGYKVIMTRTTNAVNLSNSARAAIANRANAGAFIRIHANSSDSSSVNGAMTICQTASNPYNGNLYSQSKALSTDVLDGLTSATGAKKQKVWETDTMSGINWSKVPVTIVEVGYLSNAKEDRQMSDASYQDKAANGIADGVDRFFREA